MLLTFALVVLGWIIFRAESIGDAWGIFCGMLHPGSVKALYRFFILEELQGAGLFATLMLVVEWMQRKKEHGLVMDKSVPRYVRYAIYISLLILLIFFYGSDQTFIYFQF